MALHLIVDGYNLLVQASRLAGRESLQSEMARESLLRDLALYRQRKSHAITVVFDGWQQGWGTEQREHRLGLEIIFSRRGEKADQVIQRLAAEFGSACAVVSSDREIIDSAKAQGAFVMKAQEFAGKLHERPNAIRVAAHKELDTGEDLRPKRGPDKRGNPRKLPKALRQRSSQLKRF
ncbi:MAG: NYN domain-containing protein [Nitrospira sp. CG24E]|nr:MAG: NYN domain-containing protein [Nitrospira sp. CG24E]